MAPRSTVVLAPISTSSWMTTRPTCGMRSGPRAPPTKPKPSWPTWAPPWMMTRLPISAYCTVAPGPMKQSRPTWVPAPTTALGAMMVPAPTAAPGPIEAPASTIAPASIFASAETCARGETPRSSVSGIGVAALGCRRRPIWAKACCGRGVTSTVMPPGTSLTTSGVQRTTAAVRPTSMVGVALAIDIDEHALAADICAEAMPRTSTSALLLSTSSAPVRVAISAAVNGREGAKKTGSAMEAFLPGRGQPGRTIFASPSAESQQFWCDEPSFERRHAACRQKRVEMPKLKFCSSSVSSLRTGTA